jgi:arylformamidase
LLPPLIPATLISIALCKKRGDWVVEKKNLEKILKKANSNFLEALVVRTLPNPPSKKRKNYSGTNPPYFSPDAVRFLNQLGVKHLLIDLPSLDKENDPHLTSHRIFWNLKGKNASPKTITEMIYVENKIVDGIYFLNLQIPNFFLDAAPSRPILFRVKKQAYAKK